MKIDVSGSSKWYQLAQTQKKKQLMQIQTKIISKPNQTHKMHHNMDLEKNHHLVSYNI
jgi:hypothetical protein